MAVIFSDDFNSPDVVSGSYRLKSGWGAPGNIIGITVSEGGAGYGTGVGNSGKYFVACNGNTQISHPFADSTNTVSLRSMISWIAPSDVSFGQYEPFYLFTSTIFILIFRKNGQVSIRSTNVQSETLSPSTPGVIPVDGTPFALQWHITINSSSSITTSVDVNNVQVWTCNFTSIDNMLGTSLWTTNSIFNKMSMLPMSNTAFDNLEIDNSISTVSYPVDPNFRPLLSVAPLPVVTNLAIAVGSHNFTITGVNFRTLSADGINPIYPVGRLPSVFIKDPNEVQYNTLGSGIHITSVTTTSIIGTIDFDVFPGNWCAVVFNVGLCWEGGPSPVYVCFDIGDIIPIPISVGTGIYFINPLKATKHDSYYGPVEKKIPNPTVKTGLLGE